MMKYIYILVLSLAVIACNKEDDENGILRPSLSATEVNLMVGETATVSVLNADEITATIENDSIANIYIDGCNINIEALKVGETWINVTVGLRQMSCKVTVTMPEQNKYDFTKEFEDNTSRYVSPSLTIRYDTPGIIFGISDNRKIEIIDITSGNKVELLSETEFINEGEIQNVTLKENGVVVDLVSAEIKRVTETEIWFLLTTPTTDNIIFVITDL